MTTIKLPAEVVLNTVLQTVRALGECDGNCLADLAEQYYPVPDFGNDVVIEAVFLEDTDEVELRYGPGDDDWDSIGEDEEVDDSYRFNG